MKHLIAAFATFLSAGLMLGAAAQNMGYYQAPALSDETLIFSSEGDLWRVPSDGGTALRLTTHPEVESQPKVSPDGRWIAFIGFYDGPPEIYLMPTTGGTPKRLTYEGGGVSVRGWLDSNRIVYRTTNLTGRIPRQLRVLDYRSLETTDLPFADVDQATFDETGNTLFFTRHGVSMFSDNVVLYRGGRMAQLWKADLSSDQEAVRLAPGFGAPIKHPMFWAGRIYFVSDKSGADNIWSVNLDGSDATQHTAREKWQIRSPYLNEGQIVFQSGADLFRFDLTAAATEKLDIFLMSDGDYKRRRWLRNSLQYLSDVRMNPKGDALAVTSRGRVASAFQQQRRRIDHQIPGDQRARSAAYSGDGKSIYVIIDKDEAGEIWQIPSNGIGERKQLTADTGAYIWRIFSSPHDNTLIYSDKAGRLVHVDADTGETRVIDETKSGSDDAFGQITWSSGGRYIAYTFYDARDMSRIAVFDTKELKRVTATTGKYASFAPAFSADGAWLYFISNRNFSASPGAPWGDRNMGPAFSDRGQIFAVQLDPEADFPFKAPNELTKKKSSKKPEKKNGDEKEKDKEESEGEADIAMNGLSARLFQVPVEAGNYSGLGANAKNLFVFTNGDTPSLKRISISSDKPKLSNFASNVQNAQLSADGSKIFVQTGNRAQARFFIVDANKAFPKDTSSAAIRLSDWRIAIDPKEEWRQLVLDAWRLHRDFAYDPNLRGLDWDAIRERYVPLRDRLGHRTEVDDLLSQMVAELGILHSQIRSGDQPEDMESGQPSYLGATYTETDRGMQIASIHVGEADRPETVGPLLKPGVDVRVGDVIRAVDGIPVRSHTGLAQQLTMKAGQEILLDLEREGEAHREIVVPVSRWQVGALRYGHWVQRNRERVATESDNEIGYLHMRAMGSGDAASFARDFYEHFDKDALIIDVRGNSGGNIDSWIIGTLLRKVWAYWRQPGASAATTNMQQTFRGHLVVLINEGTYSDGETFAAGVKALDIAPTIGTRTAGAGIWLSGRNGLSDGGMARIAEFAQYGADGRWLIEGRGVSPDIEVVNLPRASFNGEDAQLARAISYLTAKLETDPIPELRPRPLPELGLNGEDVD